MAARRSGKTKETKSQGSGEAARRLSFRATLVQHESAAGEVASLSFEIETDGDPSVYFSMMVEDPDQAEVRVSWGDGTDARDECVLALASAEVEPDRFRADFREPRPEDAGPYVGVDITFEPLEDGDARAATRALGAMMGRPVAPAPNERPAVARPTSARVPAPAGTPLRKGPPTLGLSPAAPRVWRTQVSAPVELVLSMSNLGGALEGVVIEIGGAALESGLVTPDRVAIGGSEASFDRQGSVATAFLPSARLSASLEGERTRTSPPPPSLPLRITMLGARPGAALVTVRACPAGRPDRTGSAMCGRSIVVDP